MWPVPFLIEGILIGVLAGEVVRRKLTVRFLVGLLVLAVLLPLISCAHKPDIEPDIKAMRWQGACQICQRVT